MGITHVILLVLFICVLLEFSEGFHKYNACKICTRLRKAKCSKKVADCKGGHLIKRGDRCGCCDTCARTIGQKCGADKRQKCAPGLMCKRRNDNNKQNKPNRYCGLELKKFKKHVKKSASNKIKEINNALPINGYQSTNDINTFIATMIDDEDANHINEFGESGASSGQGSGSGQESGSDDNENNIIIVSNRLE